MTAEKILNVEINNNIKIKEENIDSICTKALEKIREHHETNLKTSDNIVADQNDNLKLRDVKKVKVMTEKDVNTSLNSKIRPKSADLGSTSSFNANNLKKRAKSSSALLKSETDMMKKATGKRPKSAGGEPFEVRDGGTRGPRWKGGSFRNLVEVEDNFGFSRSSSVCDSCCCRNYCVNRKEQWITHYNQYIAKELKNVRKCQSEFNVSSSLTSKKDFEKYKRSLKLIGFKLSDFGIYGNDSRKFSRQKPRRCSSTLSTKINCRSISLDSLKNAIKKAFVYDCLDVSHRRLLAQAAYEQWYFKKEAEFLKRRKEEKMKNLELKKSLEKEFVVKKKKAEEEFQKWSQKKAVRKKDPSNSEKKPKSTYSCLLKTKEDSEQAFLQWKKKKNKELEKKIIEQKKEEERRKESERQKEEKKAEAEKAFQQWMLKFEENQKLAAVRKIKTNKKQEEMERRKQREESNMVSFQIWKSLKDEEQKQRNKLQREAMRIAKEERLAQIEERMYESEQAFEEWLDRVDARHKQFAAIMSYCKKVPWLPV